MGASNSTVIQAIKPSDRNSIVKSFKYASRYNPEFWYEHNMTLFFSVSAGKPPKVIETCLPRAGILDLIINCYDDIPNIKSFAEALLTPSLPPKDSVISKLNDDFGAYCHFSNIRDVLLGSLFQFSARLFMPWKFNPAPSLSNKDLPNLPTVISACRNAIDYYQGKTTDRALMTQIEAFFKQSLPPSAIPPPSKEFTAQVLGFHETFNGEYVFTHCVSSNGSFLFVLSSGSTLHVYPLLHNGGLSAPFSRTIGTLMTPRASMVATPTNLIIIDNRFRYEISISSIVCSSDVPLSISQTAYDAPLLSLVGDGVVYATIDPNYNVAVFDANNNTEIRKVQLQASHAILSTYVPQLFPACDYNTVPIVTNGAFVAFLFRIDPLNVIFRVYSLQTGLHVHDEHLASTEPVFAVALDSMSRCHWVVTPCDQIRLAIHRYYFAGSYDPNVFHFVNESPESYIIPSKKKCFASFASSMNFSLMHLMGTQVLPSNLGAQKRTDLLELLDVFETVIAMPGQEDLGNSYSCLLQSLLILIDLNMRIIYGSEAARNEVRERMLKLLPKLPTNMAAAIFFGNINFFLISLNQAIIAIMIDLFRKVKSEQLLLFSLRAVERSAYLIKLPFNIPASLLEAIPMNSEPPSEENSAILSLIFIHQRALAAAANKVLKDNSYRSIELSAQKRPQSPFEQNPLDNFGDYMQIIVTKFDSIIPSCASINELQKSFIFEVFFNFICLLSGLCEYHTIAQFATALLSVVLRSLSDFLSQHPSDLSSPEFLPFVQMIQQFLFVFAKLGATLVKGGGVSQFENEFLWVITPNINAIDSPHAMENLFSPTINQFSDTELDNFIGGKTDIMQKVYTSYKANFNRNLKDEIMLLDRICLSAICKHLGILQNLLTFNGEKAQLENLKKPIDQMIRVRSFYRAEIQKGKADSAKEVMTKSLFLLRAAKCEVPSATAISDFILCSQPSSMISNIISQQRSRVQISLVGFSLIEQTFSMQVHPIFDQVIAYCLAGIESFSGLSVIMRLTSLSDHQRKEFHLFFDRVRAKLMDDPNSLLSIFVFRFFRDIDELTDIRESFLSALLTGFSTDSSKLSFFGLAISLLWKTSLPNIPQIAPTDMNPPTLLLRSLQMEQSNGVLQGFDEFLTLFFNREISPSLRRAGARLVFTALNSKSIDEPSLSKAFSRIFLEIGDLYNKFSSLHVASDYIWILRKILDNSTRAKPQLESFILSVTPQTADITLVIGVFAVLGSFLEPIYPYCHLRFHENRNNAVEYLGSPIPNERGKYICYSLPLSLTVPSTTISMRDNSLIYAYPRITIEANEFAHPDYILSFFDFFAKQSAFCQSFYSQTLAMFSRSDSFAKCVTPEMALKIAAHPVPFQDLHGVLRLIYSYKTFPILPSINGFSELIYGEMDIASYLSPIINQKAKPFPIQIKVNTPQFQGSVGIVSDAVDKTYARYSVLTLPQMDLYPSLERQKLAIAPGSSFEFTVDPAKRTVSYGLVTFSFPPGSAFRILVATSKANQINFSTPSFADSFLDNSTPPVVDHGCINMDCDSPLYDIPPWLKKYQSGDPLPKEKADVSVKDLTHQEKMEKNFTYPPNYVAIHVGYATQASKPIVDDYVRGLFLQFSLQWLTVATVRLLIYRPEIFTNPTLLVRLFSILVVQIESFSPSEYSHLRFPFSLDLPIWDNNAQANHIYLSLDGESKKALAVLSQIPTFPDIIASALRKMSQSKHLHLVAQPHSFHMFYPRELGLSPRAIRRPQAIVSVNDFLGVRTEFIHINKVLCAVPAIVFDGPTSFTPSNPNNARSDISALEISPNTNSWVFDTPFELLVLLKNYVFICKTNEQRTIAKRILIDCFICQSPFILPYLPQIADFLQLQIPSTPFDSTDAYNQSLIVLQNSVEKYQNNIAFRFRLFQAHEWRVLHSAFCIQMTKYFPEFFGLSVPPLMTTFSVPEVPVEPGAIKGEFSSHIIMIRLFNRKYKSIIGFPFWEILPYWYRLSSGSTDNIDPTVEIISDTSFRVFNPSGLQISISLHPKGQLRAESLVLRSKTGMFDDPEYIAPNRMGDAYVTSEQSTFFSTIEIPGGSKGLVPSITVVGSRGKSSQGEQSASSLHDRFLADMTQFATQWSEDDTNELLTILPRSALREPSFAVVQSIASSSALQNKFNPTVIMLRALLIHHYNYLRFKAFDKVPPSIWESMQKLVTNEDAAEEILKSFAVCEESQIPHFQIDRTSAHRYIVDGFGDYRRSIIYQIAMCFKDTSMAVLRSPRRPWRVEFVGEFAIDAGGPARELITEASSSIFEPSTGIVVAVPNSRSNIGLFKDTFVPFERTGGRALEYRAIGILLGVIVRTGNAQGLPFAPLVWKYLAKSKVTHEDVLQVDKAMADHFSTLTANVKASDFESHFAVQWTVEQWDGKTDVLPNHVAGTNVPAEQLDAYINECLDFRIASIMPFLKEIRRGFRENVGIKYHPLMTGPILSHMAQGSDMITTQELISITQVKDYAGIDDPHVQRFFKAVDRLNSEQKKLMLRFITTLTRLPNSATNPGFAIKIDKLERNDPDSSLPGASTCFNLLHWPAYNSDQAAYEKLLVAIQYCQTMENK